MNFKVQKIKFDSDGTKVNMVYTMNDPEDAQSKEEHDTTFKRIPHPDFTDVMDELKIFLAESNSLLIKPENSNLSPKRKEVLGDDKVKKVLELLNDEIVESLRITGIAIKGDSDNMGVNLTGVHQTEFQGMAINSPLISLGKDSDRFGFETTLVEIVKRIIEEARAYVIDRKSKQLEMDLKVA